MGTTLTEEQVEELKTNLKSVNEDVENIQKLKEVKEKKIEELIEEDSEEEKRVMSTFNPVTGMQEGVSIASGYGFDSDDDVFQNMLDDMDKVENVKVEITESNIAKVLSDAKAKPTMADIATMKTCLNKKNDKGEIKYTDLPDFIKKEIDQKMIGFGLSGEKYRRARNMMANDIVENIYTNVMSEKINEVYVDLDTSIKNLAKQESQDVTASQNALFRKTFVDKFPEIANTKYADDPKKKQLLLDISDGFIQAFTLEKMYNAYMTGGRRIKPKHIEIENPSKVIRRFETKYEDNKFTIRDLNLAEDILARHVNKRFSINSIRAFIVIFCKYTENMKPENVPEHTFMYYFVNNILTLDVPTTNKDDEKYRADFLNAVNHFLNAIETKLNEGAH